MKKIIVFFIVLSSCKKEDVSPIKNTVSNEVIVSDINKKTSYYKPYHVPFYDYFLTSNYDYNVLMLSRSFIDINHNSTPDLLISTEVWPGYQKGSLIAIVDDKVVKIIDSFQIQSRKILVCDFNGDKKQDAFILESGLDVPPYGGGKNKLVLFNESNVDVKELSDIGIFHGGCAGDVDNDGDIDVFPLANGKSEFLLINDGLGNFTKKQLFGSKVLDEYFHCEFYDLNKDGNLDLVIGGHEWKSSDNKNIQFNGIFENYILWGNGKGDYSFGNSTKLPTLNGWGTITDFDFSDLDGNGNDEIIVTRTGGPDNFYNYFKIQILKKIGSDYIDYKSIDSPKGWPKSEWLDWVDIYDLDNDGILDIVPDDQELNYSRNSQYQPINELKTFSKMYFKGDGKCNFTITYKR
jgi:hypothetical protein